ncbi:hypothetical protein Hanom_Chr17g01571161 [Helianthus anomalus]
MGHVIVSYPTINGISSANLLSFIHSFIHSFIERALLLRREKMAFHLSSATAITSLSAHSTSRPTTLHPNLKSVSFRVRCSSSSESESSSEDNPVASPESITEKVWFFSIVADKLG